MRLNPYHPQRYWSHLGRAYFTARRYADALEAFKRVSAPDVAVHAYIAAREALGGDMEQAEMHARQVLAQALTVTGHLDSVHYQHAADRDRLRHGLLKSGLPEGS